MGTGRDLARGLDPGAPHHEVLENFRDQLLIALLKRLAVNGIVQVPVREVDDTGNDIVLFAVRGERNEVFHFELTKKS